ncbi:MAG: protein kinase [Leptospiraceae bacterium]|nr:protein kinase [Leptospiraceae bacterium]
MPNFYFQTIFSVDQFLPIAIRMAEIVAHIHSKIIHKDINPSNIVWNSNTNQVKIIDFGISSELSHETTSLQNVNVLERL